MDIKKKIVNKKKMKLAQEHNLTVEKGVFRIVGENVKEFCKRYNLKIKKINCENCNKELEMNIPSYCDGHACLEAPICDCGVKTNRIVFQPASKERKKFWKQVEKSIFYN